MRCKMQSMHGNIPYQCSPARAERPNALKQRAVAMRSQAGVVFEQQGGQGHGNGGTKGK